MLNNRYLIIEKDALEAWLSGASSQTDKSARLEPIGKGNGLRDDRKPRPKRGHAVKQAARAAKAGETQKAED